MCRIEVRKKLVNLINFGIRRFFSCPLNLFIKNIHEKQRTSPDSVKTSEIGGRRLQFELRVSPARKLNKPVWR